MENLRLPDRRAAVATLVATEGSSPRDAGSHMWVDDRGAIVGSVTIGGCVDARVIEESARVLATEQPTLVSMSLGDEDAWALGMTCAGTVEVLIEPCDPSNPVDPVRHAFESAAREVASGRRAVIVSPLDGKKGRLVVTEGGGYIGTLGDATLDHAALREATQRLANADRRSWTATVTHAGGDSRLYFEMHAPPVTLVVFGATHVAIPLVDLAKTLGLRTVVIDGRERFATRERFPTADELLIGMPSEIAERLRLGPNTYVVLLSHDYKYDLPVLRAVLESEAAYIGCLGSTRRGRAMLEFLAAEGIAEERLARVRIPIGLDIGARSPAEIALSAIAEAIAVSRDRSGGAMRDRTSSRGSAPA
jgi:xanthine dehydrogenase accessory factor